MHAVYVLADRSRTYSFIGAHPIGVGEVNAALDFMGVTHSRRRIGFLLLRLDAEEMELRKVEPDGNSA